LVFLSLFRSVHRSISLSLTLSRSFSLSHSRSLARSLSLDSSQQLMWIYTRGIVMEFMNVIDIASIRAVDNTSMCLIKKEANPITIIAVLSQYYPSHRYIRYNYFIPRRTLTNTIICLIKKSFPAGKGMEYRYYTRASEDAWRPMDRHAVHSPVGDLPWHGLRVRSRYVYDANSL
jgi:hypothetical protein